MTFGSCFTGIGGLDLGLERAGLECLTFGQCPSSTLRQKIQGRDWSGWDILCCPSDSDPVALGLVTEGSGCSCSVSYPTPAARDWKGMSAKSWRDRIGTVPGRTFPTLPDKIGGPPHPEFVEEVMGFQIGWTELKR